MKAALKVSAMRSIMGKKQEQFEAMEREAKAEHGGTVNDRMFDSLCLRIREYAQQRRLDEVLRRIPEILWQLTKSGTSREAQKGNAVITWPRRASLPQALPKRSRSIQQKSGKSMLMLSAKETARAKGKACATIVISLGTTLLSAPISRPRLGASAMARRARRPEEVLQLRANRA